MFPTVIVANESQELDAGMVREKGRQRHSSTVPGKRITRVDSLTNVICGEKCITRLMRSLHIQNGNSCIRMEVGISLVTNTRWKTSNISNKGELDPEVTLLHQ